MRFIVFIGIVQPRLSKRGKSLSIIEMQIIKITLYWSKKFLLPVSWAGRHLRVWKIWLRCRLIISDMWLFWCVQYISVPALFVTIFICFWNDGFPWYELLYPSYWIQDLSSGAICCAKVAMRVLVYLSILSAMTLTCALTYLLGDKEDGYEIQESGSEPSVQFGWPQKPPTQGGCHCRAHPSLPDCRHGYTGKLLPVGQRVLLN